MTFVSKEEVEHLAELSRIKLNTEEISSLQGDLERILAYFEELKEVDTSSVPPKTGGALTVNELRDDAENNLRIDGNVTRAFPEKEGNLLKVPPVFE